MVSFVGEDDFDAANNIEHRHLLEERLFAIDDRERSTTNRAKKMQRPPVSPTTRPKSVVSRRFVRGVCIQKRAFFVREKRMWWNFFREKVLLFCRFIFQLFGGVKKKENEDRRFVREEERK